MPSLEAKRLADATESLSKDATSKGTPSARFKNTVNHWGAFVLGAFLYLIQTLLMALIGANFIFFGNCDTVYFCGIKWLPFPPIFASR